jgi:hypothetical protein
MGRFVPLGRSSGPSLVPNRMLRRNSLGPQAFLGPNFGPSSGRKLCVPEPIGTKNHSYVTTLSALQASLVASVCNVVQC